MLRDFSAVTIIDPGCIYIKGKGLDLNLGIELGPGLNV